MKSRLDALKAAPAAIQAMLALEKYVKECGLEPSLVHLVKIRASQINGCAYCLDMHTHEARHDGESEQRLYLLSAWHESPLYSERERAALAWTEAVTLVSETKVPDEVYETVRTQFPDSELVNLTLLVAMINAWNRLSVSFRTVHPIRAAAEGERDESTQRSA
jgi:AhpD family alkylhydroperoxidase